MILIILKSDIILKKKQKKLILYSKITWKILLYEFCTFTSIIDIKELEIKADFLIDSVHLDHFSCMDSLILI